MLTVTAAIIVKGSKYLIARRSPHKHMGGFWEFPGGKVEEGETPEKSLEREIKEELGLNIKVNGFYMENKHRYNELDLLLKAYNCEIISGDIKLHDHDKAEWVAQTELNNYQFAPADIPILNALIKSTSTSN